jgi:putative transcriptional regulator
MIDNDQSSDSKERPAVACKLSAVLGARRIKVSEVVRATGIARATVDRYYNDEVQSFDRAVLAKLCAFLQVRPGDLLTFEEPSDLFNSKP